MVLERFVSQSPKELLIAPDWGLKNHEKDRNPAGQSLHVAGAYAADVILTRLPRH